MACCSGPTQTKQLNCIVQFRPYPDIQFQLKIELNGRNGSWSGRATGTFDFGNDDKISCGQIALYGERTITMKVDLSCTESSNSTTVTGKIKINYGTSVHQGTLRPVILQCFRGGPGCMATWQEVYMAEIGTMNITIRGVNTSQQTA